MAKLKYVGKATPTPQKTTIAVTGTWAAGDTATITCGGKTITVTVGVDVAPADICDILARAINGDAAKADETRSASGRDEGFGPFRDFKASYVESTAVLMLTSTWVPGSGYWPFTVTVGETTAGTGALGTPTQDGTGTSQACTGPSHLKAAANWDTGAAPTNSDTVIWDHGDYKVLHDLDNTATDLTVEVKDAYAGEWGLDQINTNWAGYHYPEYRQRFPDFPNSTGSQQIYIGERNSGIVPRFKLRMDLGTATATSLIVRVFNAPPMLQDGTYAVEIVGGKPLQLFQFAGSVLLGPDEKENAPELKTLYMLGNTGTVRVTDHVTLDSSMNGCQQYGGKLYFESGSGDTLDLVMYGGEAFYTSDALYGVIEIFAGGTFYSDTGGTSARIHNGGKFITTGSGGAPDTVYLYDGYYYEDEYGDLPTNGFDFIGCAPGPNFKVQPNLTWTPSAI